SLKKNATTVYDFISGGDVSPDSKFLVVSQREKKLLTSFLINRESGELVQKDSKGTEIYPRMVKFTPDGKHALVLNKGSNSISSFSFDNLSGELKLVSRADTGNDPQYLLIVQVKQ